MAKEAIYNTLEKIASALEKIADILEDRGKHKNLQMKSPSQTKISKTSEQEKTDIFKTNLSPNKSVVPNFFDLMARCGIKVLKTLENGMQAYHEMLAFYIGERYELFGDILKSIKRHMPNAERFSFTLYKSNPDTVSKICKFCSMSQELNLISSYNYHRSSNKCTFHIKTSRSPEAMNFFFGRWMELYLVRIIKDMKYWLEKSYPGIRIDYLNNIQVVIKNSLLAELDLAFRIDDSLFWVEAKSGEFIDDLERFKELSQLIDVPLNRSVLVLADVDNQTAENLSTVFDITVVPLCDFKRFLSDQVERVIRKRYGG